MAEKLVAGIDVGHSTTKIQVLKGSEIVYKNIIKSFLQEDEACRDVETRAINELKLPEGSIKNIVVSGTGSRNTKLPNHTSKPLASCLAKGVKAVYPYARTIIDVGAEMCVVIQLNEHGQIMDIVENDKCAAGVGVYYEAMAKLAGVAVDQLGSLALQAKNPFEISSTCVIFAEQEVITRVHENPDISLADVIGGICNSMARRIAGLVRRIDVKEDVILTGGVALNEGYVKFLGETLNVKPKVFEYPQLAAAHGAALYAMELSTM
jgi:predicted CoA-substrate-specific enzyme activase